MGWFEQDRQTRLSRQVDKEVWILILAAAIVQLFIVAAK